MAKKGIGHYIWVLRRLTKRKKRKAHFFLEISDREADREVEQAIPPVVYQTWPNRQVDDEHFEGIQRFRSLNPELTFTLFTDPEMHEYMNDHWAHHPIKIVYDKAVYPQIKTDIFRYCLIFDRGGYYVDFNKAIYANIRSFHRPESEILLSYDMWETHVLAPKAVAQQLEQPHKLISQWAFGFSPRHELLTAVIDRVLELAEVFNNRVVRSARDAVWALSGPGAFTDAVWERVSQFGTEDLVITDVAFDGTGVSRIRGAHRRSVKNPYYGDGSNCVILGSNGSATS